MVAVTRAVLAERTALMLFTGVLRNTSQKVASGWWVFKAPVRHSANNAETPPGV